MSTKTWRVLRYNEPKFAKAVAALNRHAQPEAGRAVAVAEIIEAVRRDGDNALVRYAKQWDNFDLSHGSLLLPARAPQVPEPVRAAVEYALGNIRDFSRLRKPRNWSRTNREGALVGEKFEPLERIGVYVPGGTAPLVSTALMTVALAKEARVREIVVVTPPPVNETLQYALRMAGATEVYQVGGAQAIAALAYGTGTIARVQKIFGPGNAFVVEAKRQVVGAVAIDQLPGPSEIAIVADDTANAAFVAADLLAQAEHGAGSQVLFLTPSSVENISRACSKTAARLSSPRTWAKPSASRRILRRSTSLSRSRMAANGPRPSATPGPSSSAITRPSRRVISLPGRATSCPPAARPRRFPA
jgi:histidinol dehydrogenase